MTFNDNSRCHWLGNKFFWLVRFQIFKFTLFFFFPFSVKDQIEECQENGEEGKLVFKREESSQPRLKGEERSGLDES